MTPRRLIEVADEWQAALSLAEEALAASDDTFAAAERHRRELALQRERRETASSLAALARLLHLRLDPSPIGRASDGNRLAHRRRHDEQGTRRLAD